MSRLHTIRLYLGGPSRELRRVRAWAAAIEGHPRFELTSRWFDGAEEWSGRDAELGASEQARRARANFEAMRRSDVIWMLWPSSELSEGAVGEVGYALSHRWHVGARNLYVVASGERVLSSIITAAADHRALRDDLAFAHCLARAEGRLHEGPRLPSSVRMRRIAPRELEGLGVASKSVAGMRR